MIKKKKKFLLLIQQLNQLYKRHYINSPQNIIVNEIIMKNFI